jgi:Protein of unknown function (DUF1102).
MISKEKLFALSLALVALVGILATGAFTTVSADRTADVNVGGDSDALLTLTEGSTNPQFVDTDSAGSIEFSITSGAQGNQDLNLNALTEIDGAIEATNNGQNDVTLNLSLSGDNTGLISFFDTSISSPNSTSDDLSEDGSVTLSPGNTVNIDVVIDTRGAGDLTAETIVDEITFQANS